MTRVRQLGYLGLEVSDLAAWERFAVDVLGLELARRAPDGSLALRMDWYEQRILLHPGRKDDVSYLGFEVACDADLEDLRDLLTHEGFAVTEADATLAAQRCVSRLLRLADPSGIAIEIFCGASIARAAFRSSIVASDFVAGDEGFGHVVISAKDAAATEHFYVDLLGMRLSDRVRVPIGGGGTFDVAFLHANARHHSLGFMVAPTVKRLHHFMLEVVSDDDVGRARDRGVEAGAALSMDLGKHPNDRMLSFYMKTPSGFDVEIGAGGVKVDDTTWRVRTYDHASLWGHKRPAPR
jgi:2,3-dihydroxybiphenyl 1,2-dioxygenase